MSTGSPEAVEAAPLRVALFGSPAFALPTLEALARTHRLLLIVAQPDKRAGRGLRLRAPAAVERARELGVPVLQPDRLKGNRVVEERLRELELDVAVTAAYGKILPGRLLEVPRHGFLNVHASLLPKYRGAAPVQWAIIRGERVTGVTIMQTEVGLDTGPIRLQRRLAIGDHATAPEMLENLARLGARALLDALELLTQGRLPARAQDDGLATFAPMLTREDGRVRWQDAAQAVYDRHRGVSGWPGSHFLFEQQRVKVPVMRPAPPLPEVPLAAAGTVLSVDGEGVRVACGSGSVLMERLQPAGKRAMAARDWANGRDIRRGARLG